MTAFRSGPGEALLLLQGVFDLRETREDLRCFDAGQTVEVAAGALGVDAGELAGGAGARDPGYRIADDAKRMRLLYQERGEVSPVADSDRPALLVYLVHAARRRMATNVAARAYKVYAGST